MVAVGDIHYPFHCKRWERWVLEQIKAIQPAYVVQVGDLKDFFFASRYAKSLNLMTPKQEITEGQKLAEDFWGAVKVRAPKARRIQIKGNHDARIDKRLFEKAPELEDLIDLESHLTFPGVETTHTEAQETFIGEVVLQHGHMKFGAHALHNLAPTITGHSHRGGVALFQNRRGWFFELNAGCGADRDSPAFAYRNRRTLDGWTLGLGVIDELGPRFSLCP